MQQERGRFKKCIRRPPGRKGPRQEALNKERRRLSSLSAACPLSKEISITSVPRPEVEGVLRGEGPRSQGVSTPSSNQGPENSLHKVSADLGDGQRHKVLTWEVQGVRKCLERSGVP